MNPPSTEKANAWLNVQRQLFARSERVKGIDFHPSERKPHPSTSTPRPRLTFRPQHGSSRPSTVAMPTSGPSNQAASSSPSS